MPPTSCTSPNAPRPITLITLKSLTLTRDFSMNFAASPSNDEKQITSTFTSLNFKTFLAAL